MFSRLCRGDICVTCVNDKTRDSDICSFQSAHFECATLKAWGRRPMSTPRDNHPLKLVVLKQVMTAKMPSTALTIDVLLAPMNACREWTRQATYKNDKEPPTHDRWTSDSRLPTRAAPPTDSLGDSRLDARRVRTTSVCGDLASTQHQHHGRLRLDPGVGAGVQLIFQRTTA